MLHPDPETFAQVCQRLRDVGYTIVMAGVPSIPEDYPARVDVREAGAFPVPEIDVQIDDDWFTVAEAVVLDDPMRDSQDWITHWADDPQAYRPNHLCAEAQVFDSRGSLVHIAGYGAEKNGLAHLWAVQEIERAKGFLKREVLHVG